MDDDTLLAVGLIGGIAAVIAAGVVLAILLSAKSCDATSKLMHLPASYSVWTDCMVEYEPGKWIPLDKYHSVDVRPDK